MKIIYNIPGTLEEVLTVAKEVKAMTGMSPDEIILDDQRKFKYNNSDFKKLERGDITPEKYITGNLIS